MSIADILMSQLGDKLAPLLKQLQGVGMDASQAKAFIGVGGEQVIAALDATGGKGPNLTAALLSKIDVRALASGVGIDEGIAKQGLEIMLPNIVQLFGKGAIGPGLIEKETPGPGSMAKGFMGRLRNGSSH